MERGIVAFQCPNPQVFHCSIFKREKWNALWETPKSFRVDTEVFPKKKRWENPMRKKARQIISLTLPVTSLPISHFRWFPLMYLPVISGDVISDETTSGDLISGDVTALHHSSSNNRPIQNDILLTWFELTTFVVIGTDCTGSCISNYCTITTTTAPVKYQRSIYSI